MKDTTKKLDNAAVDAALEKLQKSVAADETINLEKAMTVDKRAMGGATKKEDEMDNTGVGREKKDVANPELGRHPASQLSGNFAAKYKEGNGLEDAAREDGVKDNPMPNRGMSKAVDKKSGKSSGSSGSSSASSPAKMEKAVADKKSGKSSGSSGSSSASSPASKMEKAVAPKEQSAASSGSESGAERLKVTKGITKECMSKSIDLINSAKKHLTKAFEDGSDTDLDTTGKRLISAKENILKAIESGEKVAPEVITRLDKAARYFGKALETYEREDAEGHVKAVNKTQKHMSKAIEAYQEFEKSLEAAPIKKENPAELKLVKQGDKYVMEMTEDQAALVRKSLVKDNLYKSLETSIPEETKKTIDAVPAIKELFKSLAESNDNLRDVIADKSEKDRDFRKSVVEALDTLSKGVKQALGDVEELKATPKLRKSVVSVVESPKDESKDASTFDRSMITATLEKGLQSNLITLPTFLAWDVDKDLPEVPEKYIQMCKEIEARTK